MKSKALLGFRKLSDADLLVLAKSIEAGTVNNAYFTKHNALIEEFRQASRGYADSVPKHNSRNAENAAAKNLKREVLLEVMDALGHAVMSVARGNREILGSSGFELSASTEKRGLPGIPENVEGLYTATPGRVVVRCKADRLAKIYKARISTDQVVWKFKDESTSTKVYLNDIPAGVILYLQMSSKNSLGESGWSSSVAMRIPLPGEPQTRKA